MTLDIKMPIDKTAVSFEVPESAIGLSIEFSSDKLSSMNFLIYDDGEKLRGQHMGYSTEGSIWLGPSKALSSAYSLPHIGSRSYKIINLITSRSAFDNIETRGSISFYSDFDQYVEAYLSQDYVSPVHRWVSDQGDQIIDYTRIPVNKRDKKSCWMAGDFHSHTVFSDGQGTREDAIYAVKLSDLDFFFPSDHLIFPLEWLKTEDLLVMPSSEITTIYGHFNYYFGDSPYKDSIPLDQSKKENVIHSLSKTKGNLSLNHPFRGREAMTLYDLDLGLLDSIEVINSPLSTISDLANIRAGQAWSRLWNMGHDLVGRGGSDAHVKVQRYDKEKDAYVRLGNPTSYVLAEKLNGQSIKEGMENKRLAFSSDGRPSLTFTSNEINGPYKGENAIGVKADMDRVELEFSLIGSEGLGLSHEWIIDGRIHSIENTLSSTKTFSREDSSWIRVDVRDSKRRLVGSVNPIRLSQGEKIGNTWQDMLDQNPPIKAVLFDKDGTLIEYSDLWQRATSEFINEQDLSQSKKEACKDGIGLGPDGTIRPGSALASGTLEQIANIISYEGSIDIGENDLKEKYSQYFKANAADLVPRTDLANLFQAIKAKGLMVGVVTSDSYDLAIQQFEALDIKDEIDFIYGGEMLDPKPSPSILMDIEDKYQIGLDEMVYVGDSDIDMRFGSYTQMAIAIKSDVSSNDLALLADKVIDDLDEVLELI